MDLGFLRGEARQDAAEAERVLAEARAHKVVASRRRIALVEDKIDDLEHRGQPRVELRPGGHLEGNARLGERAFRTNDALRDGRHWYEKSTRDLFRRQTREQTKREGDARLGRE